MPVLTLILATFLIAPHVSAQEKFFEVGSWKTTGETALPSKPDAFPAYRVESFGDLTMALRAQANLDEVRVQVEGPFLPPQFGDDVVPGTGHTDSYRLDSANPTTIRLKQPGLYRLLFTFPEVPGVLPRVQSRCTDNCNRPALLPVQLFRELERAGSLDILRNNLTQVLADVVKDRSVAQHLHAKIVKALPLLAEPARWGLLDRFPYVKPLYTFVPQARPVLPSAEGVNQTLLDIASFKGGDLLEVLADCKPNRAEMPKRVHPKIPQLGYGHYIDQSLTRCQIAQSQKLAAILSALARGAGSSVPGREPAGGLKPLRNPSEIIQFLVSHGHTITLTNDRTYANFIAFTFDLGTSPYTGSDTVWPLWLDTGIETDKGSLTIPMGHSQQTFTITGPAINAKVAFFLGIDGVGFFPVIDRRPEWTGWMTEHTLTSTNVNEYKKILTAAEIATKYVQRNKREVAALKLKHDGYGYLGVCNDSNALIEVATHGTVTTFPIVRAAGIVEDPAHQDGLEKLFAALPHDADATKADFANSAYVVPLLQRILKMTPLPLDDQHRAQLEAAKARYLSATPSNKDSR